MKLLLFGILLLLFSIPLMLFTILSYFNCGFVEGKMCCYVDHSICCVGQNYMGCITMYSSNMEELCKDYCFELRSRVTAGFNPLYLNSLQYCRNNCTHISPCPVTLPNGTTFENVC